MSIRALLLGVEKRLRSAAVFNDVPDDAVGRYVGIQPAPGKPPPNWGQYFFAVHWGGGQGNDKNPQRHDVSHGVTVTVSARLNYAPKDRQAKRLTTANDIYDLVDRIAAPNVIHGNWLVLTNANELITGTAEYVAEAGEGAASVNGYIETLVLGPYGPERPAPAGWGGVAEPSDTFIIDIRFNLARRIQANY